MTKKIMGITLCLIFLLSMLPMMAVQNTANAGVNTTTSITVTKYAADGTTVLAQETLSLADLQAMPVQGDGDTHYFMQGFTNDNTSFETMWDPGETVNLKDKGAVMGTDVKDLCELVGGAASGDQIEIKAVDGYGERFHYEDVYNPEPEQGKFVICWYTKNAGDTSPQLYPDGAYVPDFDDGMQLVFMAQTTNIDDKYVFGNWDMHETLPDDNWHYYYAGTIQYPSANGLSIKWISEVAVYTQPEPQWSIEVTGIVNQTVDQGWFENALACHETASWTDGSGNVWSGLPLWYLCGLADDTVIHGPGAFNDAVAAAGYTVEVRAIDDYAKTFASADVARSDGYIIANQKNGAPLSVDDGYPLKLVGTAVTPGSNRVGNIASINLLDVPIIETWSIDLIGAQTYMMTQAEFESGALCHGPFEYIDPEAGTYNGMPLWLLCGWVDDDVQHGPGAFNDALATTPPGYQVKVTAIDGYYFTFDSTDVARNDGIIVASKLDGEDLPGGEYPARLIGDGFAGGSGWKVREIASIELVNLPAASYTLTVNTVGSGTVSKDPDEATYDAGTPVQLTANPAAGWTFNGWSDDAAGMDNPVIVTMDANKTVTATFVQQQWSLQLNGMDRYTMPQSEFEALAADYPLICVVTNKDGSQDTYTGAALWRLVGMVDDEDAASMNGTHGALDYSIAMVASDGFTRSLTSTQVLNNDTYIVANMMNGVPLPANRYPLRVVWEGNTSGSMVSMLEKIEFAIPWNIELVGASSVTMSNTEFVAAAAADPVSWVDGSDTWDGLSLWRLVAIVDDGDPATFNDTLASIGYSVKIIASDGYNKTFDIGDIARNDTRIIANKFNAYTLPPNRFPLRFVGPGLSGSQKVSQIVRIELVDLPVLMPVFSIDKMTVDYGRQDDRDAVYMNAKFTLPEGVTCDLSTQAVKINIDGYIIDIPAGSFKNLGGYVPRNFFNNLSKNLPNDAFRDTGRGSQTYVYRTIGNNSPDILAVINFKKGDLNLVIRKANVDIINNYDGVSVTFSIGNVVGVENINMFIDALTYPKQR
jgi:uncharacterized repeat protein (TIGR02543 family)